MTTLNAQRPAFIGGSIAVVVGALALAGWVLGVDGLKSIVPGTITMKANTAVAFVVLGVAVVVAASRSDLRSSRVVDAMAVATMLLGAIVGLQYVAGADFGIDQLIFREPTGAIGTVDPGRMSPQTAVSFVVLGAGLLARRSPRGGLVFDVVLSLPALLGTLNLIDAVLGGTTPTFLAAYTQMALPSAVACIALSLAIMDLLPGETALDRFRGSSDASAFARGLLVAALTIPVAVAWLRVAGERAGFYGTTFGTTLTTLSTIVLFVAVILGVTKALQAAEGRRAAAAAEVVNARAAADDANRAKTEFLSRMSHELRTPLNAILGFAQLLELDELDPAQEEYVRYIRRGGEQLLSLINEVLDISRIEAGSLSLSPEPVWLPDVIDEQGSLMRPLAAERGVTIRVDPSDSMRVHVHADRQRLKQVLVNLLSNAVKYNRRGGDVSIAACEPGPGRIRIDVTDTGFGIAADKLDRLFVPFDRLGAEASKIEGTGIGLALSRRLVEEMGGTLSVSSTPDVGTTFSVELPRVADPVDRAVATSLTRPRPVLAPAKLVLHIEDNLSNLRLVEQLVRQRPAVGLVTAMQGRIGLDLAREHVPDLILLDLHLPDMTGRDVLVELKSDPRTRPIPVVVLSADSSAGSIERLKAAGASSHLSKPIDVEAIYALLDETPERRRDAAAALRSAG